MRTAGGEGEIAEGEKVSYLDLTHAVKPNESGYFANFPSILYVAFNAEELIPLQDEITSQAVRRLQQHGLSPATIAKTEESKLADIIYPVGFYRRKAKYIKQATDVLLENYEGDIPDSIKVRKVGMLLPVPLHS
eukprot:gb/GECG01013555.1/.p1 GENE.gb/GECG01013555.1/~~gb/GECG01013555.1/.p1  ORF type:complete len:134 (+),score=19.41 gb/GECG01013555.1/:1-402(+)